MLCCSVTFLGLSCLSSVLEIMMDMHPVIRRVVAMGVSSPHFSVSITLSIIGNPATPPL
jgi:hypothetical protein